MAGIASAVPVGSPGDKVDLGASDFIPHAQGPNLVLSAGNVLEVDMGVTGSVADNCFYFAPYPGGLLAGALRLTECVPGAPAPKPAGSFVLGSDDEEHQAPTTPSGFQAVVWADVNNNNRYDREDAVYATTGGTGDLHAMGGNTHWSIRLAEAFGFPAGTMVRPGDADHVAFAPTVREMRTGSGVAFWDRDLGGRMSLQDAIYLANGPTGVPGVFPHEFFPLFSVRLNDAVGAFGSKTDLGDADNVPLASFFGFAASSVKWKVAEYGAMGDVTDDCFYLGLEDSSSPLVNDLRLSDCATGADFRPAGTLVEYTDPVDLSLSADTVPADVVYADRTGSGRYDRGDYVYATTGGPSMDLPPTVSHAQWSLRLTPAFSFPAGRPVFAGDPDAIAFGTAAGPLEGGAWLGVVDVDENNRISRYDHVAISPEGVVHTRPFFYQSVRLFGGFGPYGSQIVFGDRDGVPFFLPDLPTASVEVFRLPQGSPHKVTDDCFYALAQLPAGGEEIRLTPCGKGANERPAGTILGPDATKEWKDRGDQVPAGTLNLVTADVNSDGRYNCEDTLYATTGGPGDLHATTGPGQWSIRLTPAYGGHGPGTFVLDSDIDYIAFAPVVAAMPSGSLVQVFDQNVDARVDAGDGVYVTSQEPGAPRVIPTCSVRLLSPELF